MPRVTIDGREIEVEPGTTVLQAASKLGIFVPHYCYHPGISISGNCRMCLVEVEGMPKLTTGCTQPVADGMVVHTETAKVKSGQADVLEYLLKNHPLDCPVCDQAGECLLQDFYMEYDRKDSRLRETKHKKAKAKSIGPRIVLDQERCILCTRCVRFLTEVTKTSELGVFGRGAREVLDVFPGRDLDNPYDANVVDLCPVGALTDKDFRFRTRSWYLTNAMTVCDSCSTNCSIFVDYNKRRPYKNDGKSIVRYRPRVNHEVNGHWMCNHGRYSYKKHEENRLLVPQRREGSDWPGGVTAAIERLARELGPAHESGEGSSIGVIVAPLVSNEEAFFLLELFRRGFQSAHVDYRIPGLVEGASPDDPPIDGILRRKDPWPNSRGCELIGLAPAPGGKHVPGMIEAAAKGDLSHLIVIGADLTRSSLDQALVKRALETSTSVALMTHRSDMEALCDITLPIATHAERMGTFTNYRGIVQRFQDIVAPMGESRTLLSVLAQIGGLARIDLPEASPPRLFEQIASRIESMKGLTYEGLAERERVEHADSQWTNDYVVPQL